MQEILRWIGLDVGKSDHHATVVDSTGAAVLDRGVCNDEAAIEKLLDDAGADAALVIDQPGSIGVLAVAVVRRRGVPIAYVPGLVMRRASQLYPGEAKTDRRDSFVIADTARIHQARVHWLSASDELLEDLRVLGGYDDDLANDRARVANRLRDMLLQTSPNVERVLGSRLDHAGSGRCWSATPPRRRCTRPASVAIAPSPVTRAEDRRSPRTGDPAGPSRSAETAVRTGSQAGSARPPSRPVRRR